MNTSEFELRNKYRAWGGEVAEEIRDAANNGASVSDLMDILDSSGFDGDICEFL